MPTLIIDADAYPVTREALARYMPRAPLGKRTICKRTSILKVAFG